MHLKSKHAHFEGKAPLEHLLEARLKKEVASSEIHGTEMPGHISACADSAKETALLLTLLSFFSLSHGLLLIFSLSWLIWKTGRSAILGYSRLERMHRVIQEERWEIEHHRPQEKEELRALYQARGFSGKLLDDAVEVLMADDNRLLEVMLREELGFQMESLEHPLKQASGALVGVLLAAGAIALALFWLPPIGVPLVAALIIALSAGLTARFLRNHKTPSVIWNLAVALLAVGAAWFFL